MSKAGTKELQQRALYQQQLAKLAARKEVMPNTQTSANASSGPRQHKARPSATLSEPGAKRPKKKTAAQRKKPRGPRISSEAIARGDPAALALLAQRRSARNDKQAELMRQRRAADKAAKNEIKLP